MFSTFADVFGSDDNNTKKINGAKDPFEPSFSTTATVDPFGVSSDMKLSASSQKFDDSPFVFETTNEQFGQTHNGNETVSSSNRSTYQTSTNEITLDPLATFDPFEEIGSQTKGLSISAPIPHSKSVNLINPFSIPTIPNEPVTVPIQASPIDLLFDINVDPSSLPPITTDKSLQHSDQVQSAYDLLGLNQKTSPSTPGKVLKSDSLSDLPKISQTKKSSEPALQTKSNIHAASSYHTLPTNIPPTSPSSLRMQATTLSIMTGTTSTTPFNDQFLDWLTQSDDLMCAVDPKLSGPSKKIDNNILKSTEDLLGSIYKQPIQPLTTLQEVSHESVGSPPSSEIARQFIRRPSNEDVPSICIHEPTSDHNDSNVVPQGYFDTKGRLANDSDDSDDGKMVFKIGEKKTSVNQPNILVPLLPPPPSPSKHSAESGEDASVSSESADEDENDPLAMFRSKSLKKKTDGNQNKNLIADWDEEETQPTSQEQEEDKNINQVEARVCLMYLYIYSLLSCLCQNRDLGWCCLLS